MTPIQLDNWKQFAQRMAWADYQWRTERRRRKLVETVGDYIDRFMSNWDLEEVHDWDGNAPAGYNEPGTPWRDRKPIAYPCDDFGDYLYEDGYFADRDEGEPKEGEFGVTVICCIRAGFDIAVRQSGGVMGSRYTVGMLRRMFPEGLPEYVHAWTDELKIGWGDDAKPSEPFDTLPADMRLWL